MAAVGAAMAAGAAMAGSAHANVAAVVVEGGGYRWSSRGFMGAHLFPFSPSCGIRSKKPSPHQKRAQTRKISRKSPTVGLDRSSMDNTKSVPENNLELPSASPNDITNDPELATFIGNAELFAGAEVMEQSNMDEVGEDIQIVKRRQNDNQKRHSGIQIEDLITMIKDAEKDILLLNQARARALKELDQVRAEKEYLQGEIDLLRTRLAEADARLRYAAHEKIKNELLADEVEILKKGIAERESIWKDGKDLKVNNTTIKEHFSQPPIIASELKALEAENESLKEEVNVLKSKLIEISKNGQYIAEMEKERLALEESTKQLQSKLVIAEANAIDLAKVKSECQVLQRKVEHLQAELEKSTERMLLPDDITSKNQALQEKVDRLEEALAQAQVDSSLLEQTQEENLLLNEQIKLLEQRLLESDNDIKAQLQIYQEEVQAFQRSLEQLKHENNKKFLDGPVQDLPWDFWSNLLLSLDGWMLEKKMAFDDAKILRDMAWRRESRIRDAYVQCKDKNEKDIIANLLKLIKASTRPGLHMVHIAAEMAPVAKVGGLGDVVAGLGKALQKKGHLVEIILPKYDCMDYSRVKKLKVLDMQIDSYFDGQLFKNKVWLGTVEGLPVYFIEPHHPAKFFWRGQFYGEGDDFRRFTFFSRAALEFLLQSGKKPDIIHCHDWQTAFVAPMYWDIYAPQGLNSARIAFTCHNFEYQGTESATALASCGLDVQQLNRPDRMQDNFRHDRVNSVKGGIVFSNIVTTVSPTYAEEVRASEGGRGLHLTLAAHSKKFFGILNGIDTEAWDPSTDPLLDFQYSANDLNGKAENKAALRKFLGLAVSDARIPLVGCITRIVPQKGVHLIRHAIYRTLECGGQFVLLGYSPIPHIQREFEGIANQFCEHPSIRLILKYDEVLSHCIYGASDIFIIPSIFEPCGLTQMIAMRYGSIPVVRRTGGLNDSVFDVDDETIPAKVRNGFTFSAADEQGLNHALDRAITYYRKKPNWWLELVKKVMKIDFSWDSSATQYEELYEKALARARAQQAHISSSTQ